MKRLLSALFCMLLVAAAFAQNANEHLKYMGIPITGTISQFHSKLAAKGVRYDQNLSSMVNDGVRVFKGTFAGNKATIFVYYDTKTKIVYRVKSVFDNLDENIADTKYRSMRQLFMQKYDDISYGEQADKETLSINTNNGSIAMYIVKDSLLFPFEYSVHIDYEDGNNAGRHDDNLLDEI